MTRINQLAFVTALLTLAVGLALLPEPTRAVGADIRITAGLATNEVTLSYHPGACGTAYWHCDEGNFPNNTGLDQTNALGSTGGRTVYFSSYAYSGYGYGVISNHQYGSSYCPGTDVTVWVPYPDSSVGTWIGSFNFVQINAAGFGSQFYFGSGWTAYNVGTVVNGPGSGNCSSTGSHLHQSGTHNAPFIYTNWDVDADDDSGKSGVQINPTGAPWDNWLHVIFY